MLYFKLLFFLLRSGHTLLKCIAACTELSSNSMFVVQFGDDSDPPTPTAAPPDSKVRRMRASPFSKKSGRPSPVPEEGSDDPDAEGLSASDDENDAGAAPTPPPAEGRRAPRRGAAAAKKQYVDLMSGDEEESVDESSEEESDFEPVTE